MKSIFLLAIIVVFGVPSLGNSVKFAKVKSQKFFNNKCESTGSCNLKEFRLDSQNYVVDSESLGTPVYGTRTYMSYKINNNENYQDFAFVQYIKGCVFESKVIKGKQENSFRVNRVMFDETKKFVHKDWQIDSIDKDPMYANIPADWVGEVPIENRHSRYMWGEYGNFDEEWESSIAFGGPKKSFVYTVDRPANAFYLEGTARNVSLEFKTCIYKTEDVPLLSSETDKIPNALSCLGWKFSKIYNHKKNKFEEKKSIDPICKQFVSKEQQ